MSLIVLCRINVPKNKIPINLTRLRIFAVTTAVQAGSAEQGRRQMDGREKLIAEGTHLACRWWGQCYLLTRRDDAQVSFGDATEFKEDSPSRIALRIDDFPEPVAPHTAMRVVGEPCPSRLHRRVESPKMSSIQYRDIDLSSEYKKECTHASSSRSQTSWRIFEPCLMVLTRSLIAFT